MKKGLLILIAMVCAIVGSAQKYNLDSALSVLKFKKDSTIGALKMQRDSIFRASAYNDSVKVEKEFVEKIKWNKIRAVGIYPVLNGGENSGVVPVPDADEIPDPTLKYKMVFELTANNPDSIIKEINGGLTEVARVINLHVASGIPMKNIFPVIVVHAGALNAITNNEYFLKKYKITNPNIPLIESLEKLGTKFIACGQAMAFIGIKKEALLPMIKVSLTAKTAFSSYQLKGYVWYYL